MTVDKFQFPSNGKAVQNYNLSLDWERTSKVSIPFKREGGSKHTQEDESTKAPAFQFPSNGKAVPNEGSGFQPSAFSFQSFVELFAKNLFTDY